MTIFRRLRRGAAFLALVSVLFSQLAVAAYACPGGAEMARAVVAETSMPECDKHPRPAERSALCLALCQQGALSSDRAGASAAPAAMPCAPPSMMVVAPVEAPGPAGAVALASLLERPTGPPLSVRHCCLRI